MVPFGGWDMPLAYPSGTLAEHAACRTGAVIFDVSHLGTVRVEGEKAFEQLQNCLTNDLSRVAPGRAQYTHLLDKDDASVLDDIIVWWVSDHVFDVMPNASNTDRVVAAIGGTDTTNTRAVIAVQGPGARSVVAKFCAEAAAVRRFTVQELQVCGFSCVVAGTGYTGEDVYLKQSVFHKYHTEHEMLRYLRGLADKDLALDRTMIPLGSCTMKLNATTEMEPVTWPEFSSLHPYAPSDESVGIRTVLAELEAMLVEITGYDAVSLQPNAGSQGEFAGLMAIRAYHRSRGDMQRTICLIPSSAHGTNAASAVMAGMSVVVVACDDNGNVDVSDLTNKAELAGDKLAAIMVTYPSTHGVFEEAISDICEIIHSHGGQVYVDGANLNALVGTAQPGKFGADVSHLNLHKTFCIPHGGGGPGVGPVAVRSHLIPFLPSDPLNPSDGVGPVSAANFGSASICAIPWVYISMMSADGLLQATSDAILSANYVAHRLNSSYPVLYTGANNTIAHECILNVGEVIKGSGLSIDDIAKRLMDYGLHAPTMSFPVANTLMVEPTESESLAEVDRFCDAMISIRREIEMVLSGLINAEESVLHHAPHTVEDIAGDWNRSYSRASALYPLAHLRSRSYYPSVSRIDAAYGDRNLVCTCAPIEQYAISLEHATVGS